MDRSLIAELPRPAQQHYRLIVISPHLDDAVFSCTARMVAARREGSVLVINVFSRFAGDVRSRAVVLGDHRYAEEAAAAQMLGFESLRLDALDVSFRDVHYQSLPNIFGPPVQGDLDWRPALGTALKQVLSGVTTEQLLVPLGVGWHVDHVLMQQVFSDPHIGGRVAYYEDMPYALIPHAVRYRLNDLVAADAMPGLPQAPLLASWLQASASFWRTAMVANLQPWLLRQGAKPAVAAFLLRQLFRHRTALQSGPGLRLRPDVMPMDEHDLALKLRAMQCYASQFREFFLSENDCAQQLRLHAAQTSQRCAAAECVWVAA